MTANICGDLKKRILIPGITGTFAAFLIFVADLVWKLPVREQGLGLAVATYAGVFLFPFWLGGIWVLYQGLKKAGTVWSLPPCLALAYMANTINVFIHANYPQLVILDNAARHAGENLGPVLQSLQADILLYYHPMQILFALGNLIVAIWIAIPIFSGKSSFPRWFGWINPLFPILLALVLDPLIPGIFEASLGIVPSAAMVLVFALSTLLLLKGPLVGSGAGGSAPRPGRSSNRIAPQR